MSGQTDDLPRALTPGAQRLIEAAAQKQKEFGQEQLSIEHWLLALIERHAPMAEAMAAGFNAALLRQQLSERVRQGGASKPLDKESVLKLANERAAARSKDEIGERDLAAAILTADGYTIIEQSAAPPPVTSQPQTTAPPSNQTDSSQVVPAAADYRPRAKQPTPTLEQFGRDLTREATAGKLPPFVGREEEIQLALETLCRRTKRNPVLVGPAGVGKTAIVEGLAQRIVAGDVPDLLKGSRLLAIQPSTLVAGASLMGEVEKRMKAIISEASQDGVLLFIDEVHSIMGAGGREGTSDIASLLKPALSRGELACIAATTDDEYRRFIETDAALERRFQPIRINELSIDQTFAVLAAIRDEYERHRNVQVADDVLRWLLDFADRSLRNRYFPDKAVDLLEQCVAHAIARGKKVVDLATARTVAQRMIGMPIESAERQEQLKEALLERALLVDEDIRSLLNRLNVTMRGLDLKPARPNAVILLIDDSAANGEALSETIASAMFGSGDRVVTIDFSRFTQSHDITMLIGAPPGYIGYSESLPLHRVAQMPWCVLRCENIHACHPSILEVLTNALAEGFITDARGKRIYLSDTVVVLTADIRLESRRRIPGFQNHEPAREHAGRDAARLAAEAVLGAELVAQSDLVCAEVLTNEQAWRRWLERRLLKDISDRYQKQGVGLKWDESLIDWLMKQKDSHPNQRDWERLVDERLSPALVSQLPQSETEEAKSLVIRWDGSDIQVEIQKPEERS